MRLMFQLLRASVLLSMSSMRQKMKQVLMYYLKHDRVGSDIKRKA